MEPRPPQIAPFHHYPHTDYLHNDLQGFRSCRCLSSLGSSILHGLATEQVTRQQCIDWGGTAHDPALLCTRRSPQAGILLHATPQQLSTCFCSACCQAAATAAAVAVVVVVPVGRVTDWMGGSRPCPTHPCLIRARSSLPAGCSTKQLALCKEAIYFLFPGKLCQDGGVPEHAPGRR